MLKAFLKEKIKRIIISRRIVTSENYYRELHSLLKIDSAEGFDLIRIGRDYDGGYIMLDDFEPGGIAYSFGISGDVSWDKDMALRGYDVFMYDHTIDGLPEENTRFHWSKLGIADGVTHDDRLKTLEELISRNGHEGKRDMILKMDVEGAEWGFLESVKPETLSQFSQMTFELHNMIKLADHERVLNILRKINETHQLVHLHANNVSSYVTIGGRNFAALFEVSYVLRDKYKFSSEYDVKLPLKIDMPNITGWPEIELGYWNRKLEFDGRIIYTPKYCIKI
ncbi:MAG: FkbM family methyltransferase [Synergistaceae bacterium]|nr:FkbM family methyltransferase [Synergistaceae bacterium]